MREMIDVISSVSSQFIPALARRAPDNSNSSKQPAEADPNKKKIIRKARGGIKVPSSDPTFKSANYLGLNL